MPDYERSNPGIQYSTLGVAWPAGAFVTNNSTALQVVMKEQFTNFMKIITLHKPVSTTHLYNLLNQELNPQFQKHKPTAYKFTVSQNGNSIDITLPELYEGVLYHIEPADDKLCITRSEHYVDDINSLALESALNELFEEFSGKGGTDLVQEG